MEVIMQSEIAFHRLVRRLQQQNRVVGRSAELDLALAEVHMLVELDATPGRGVGELAQLLRIDQSFASKLVQLLARRKLVSVGKEREDARRKRIVLTAAGRHAVRRLDEHANDNYRAMRARISRADEEVLVSLFRAVADGFGQPSAHVRPAETPYRAEQRRLTRCCGLLGDAVFGSQISAAMWQVLGEVVLSPVRPQPGELAMLLSVAQNSLSSIVTTMEKKKFLQRRRVGRDGRAIELHPLPAGIKLYRQMEMGAAERIRAALVGRDADCVARGVEVFRRFLADCGQDVAPLPSGLRVIRIDSRERRAVARGLIARALVREGFERCIPERFVPASSENIMLVRDGSCAEEAVVAALELDLSAERILSCGWDESISPWGLASFVGEALVRYPTMRRPFKSLCESFPPLAAYLGIKG